MRKLRVAVAMSCFLSLGLVAGPLGSARALADKCHHIEVDVPSLSIELTPHSRSVRRGRTAWVGVRITRLDEGTGNSRVAVPAGGVDVLLFLDAGNATIVDGVHTDRSGRATFKFRIPTSAKLGAADVGSSAHREVHRAGCVVVSEQGQIQIPDFLRIRA